MSVLEEGLGTWLLFCSAEKNQSKRLDLYYFFWLSQPSSSIPGCNDKKKAEEEPSADRNSRLIAGLYSIYIWLVGLGSKNGIIGWFDKKSMRFFHWILDYCRRKALQPTKLWENFTTLLSSLEKWGLRWTDIFHGMPLSFSEWQTEPRTDHNRAHLLMLLLQLAVSC